MTDEMMMQTQSPSVLPWALGTGAVAAAAGGLLPQHAGFLPRFSKPKYASFDDIIKESHDSFTSSIKEAKNVEEKEAYEKAKNEKETFDKKLEDITRKAEDIGTNKDNWEWRKEIKEKAETEIIAYDNAERKVLEADQKLVDAVKKKMENEGITDFIKKEDYKALDDAGKLARVKEYIEKQGEKLTADESLFKVEAEELKSAKEALEEAETKLKGKFEGKMPKKTLTEPAQKVMDELKTKINTAKEEGSEAVKNILDKMKTPNKWLNVAAYAGAGLLLGAGLGALFRGSKSEE